MSKKENTANVSVRFNEELQNKLLNVDSAEKLIEVGEELSGMVDVISGWMHTSQFFNEISSNENSEGDLILTIEHVEDDDIAIAYTDILVPDIEEVSSYIDDEEVDHVEICMEMKNGSQIFVNISCVEVFMEVETPTGVVTKTIKN